MYGYRIVINVLIVYYSCDCKGWLEAAECHCPAFQEKIKCMSLAREKMKMQDLKYGLKCISFSCHHKAENHKLNNCKSKVIPTLIIYWEVWVKVCTFFYISHIPNHVFLKAVPGLLCWTITMAHQYLSSYAIEWFLLIFMSENEIFLVFKYSTPSLSKLRTLLYSNNMEASQKVFILGKHYHHQLKNIAYMGIFLHSSGKFLETL